MVTLNMEKTKMLVFEVEKLSEKEGIEKELFVINDPLANSFKVSNGKITAYVYMGDDSIEMFVVNEKKNSIKKVVVDRV
ncbi:MAG: hypothetical protein GXN99_03125 [Candidatus Nanohaloarchaeota archaeon]|nr:hypothetical protein [Candidatus Nanohaloarchaeota archaeon]